MNKKRILFSLSILLLSSLACLSSLSQPGLESPAGSTSNQVPLYPNTQGIEVTESDVVAIIGDMLGTEYLLYNSSTDISWTDDTGTKVQEQIDELLPESRWRLESDWYSSGQFYISTWRYGDLRVVVAYLDNLDSDQISNLERRYGISGPQPGSTLVITHLWDFTKPLPTPTFPVSIEFEVFANLEWQKTGIFVQVNDKVEINYISGTWSINPPWGYVGAEGHSFSPHPTNPIPGAQPGTLIGRIGESFFQVGQRLEITSQDEGHLYFQMNDDDLDDNGGSLVIQVAVQKP